MALSATVTNSEYCCLIHPENDYGLPGVERLSGVLGEILGEKSPQPVGVLGVHDLLRLRHDAAVVDDVGEREPGDLRAGKRRDEGLVKNAGLFLLARDGQAARVDSINAATDPTLGFLDQATPVCLGLELA